MVKRRCPECGADIIDTDGRGPARHWAEANHPRRTPHGVPYFRNIIPERNHA